MSWKGECALAMRLAPTAPHPMGMMASFIGSESMDKDKLIAYIRKRRNPDGGYVFARGLQSTPQDTFYALSCLRMLGAAPQEPMRSMEYARTVLDETPTLFLVLEQPVDGTCPLQMVWDKRA